MAEYTRDEMDEMVERWLEANRKAEAEGNWARNLGPMYTEDAEYHWNVGPGEDFLARGRKQIEDWALGVQMEGFQGWEYPYEKVLIDEKQGEVVAFWKQIAPGTRSDGSPYQVAGVGGSHFRYGGDFRWCWQRDFFDLGNTKSLFFELAADGKLDPVVKQKLRDVTRGKGLAGHVKRPDAPGLVKQIRGMLAMTRIVLTGS